MRRLSALVIPLPVAFVFLCAFAYAGWHMAGRATASGLELQIAKLEALRR
jgi:hypothetical protein